MKHKRARTSLRATLVRGLAGLALVLALSACKDGEGVKVRHLSFEGVQQVSETELRLAVTTSGSSRWPWGSKTYFKRQDFNEDLKRLESFYISRGYPDARVASFRTEYNADKTEMDLTVVIAEGSPVIVQSVELVGFDALPPGHLVELRDRITLKVGEPRDQERVQVVRGMALDELRDHGYPAATVAVTERAGLSPHGVVVTYTAEPGAYAEFGEVMVQGNKSVSAEVITRQLDFKRGDEFSLSALKTSQRRLHTLDLFQFANVETGDATKTPGEVAINVTVVEAPHRKWSVGIGYGSEDHARVGADFHHVNFLGGAREAGIEGKYSSLEHGVRVHLNEPSLGRGLSLGLSGQHWFADAPAYTLRTTGARLGLLRTLSRGDQVPGERARHSMSLSFAREFESYQVSDAALDDAAFRPNLIALGLNPLTGEGKGTVASVSADIQRNTVGNLLDATSGSLLNAHVEVARRVLGGTFAYQLASGEIRAYKSLSTSVVVAAHVRAGGISASGDPETSVPFVKRYFLGGATSLRGWGRFEVAPLTPNGLPIGGYSMLESSAEVRLLPNARGSFGIVGFVDAGNVWDKSWRVYVNDLRSDIGVGIRYRTPVGPLRLDFAYQLTPIKELVILGNAPGDYRRWRLHFSIGQAF